MHTAVLAATVKYYNEHHEGRGGNAEIYVVHTVVGYVVHTAGLSFMSKDFTVHPGGLGDNEKNYAVHALPFRSNLAQVVTPSLIVQVMRLSGLMRMQRGPRCSTWSGPT